jgi:hypothetical protein
MRCATCKHYTPNVNGHLGSCARWRGGDGSDGYGWVPKEIPINGVVVETDEGWGARMGPEFGCVLWMTR